MSLLAGKFQSFFPLPFERRKPFLVEVEGREATRRSLRLLASSTTQLGLERLLQERRRAASVAFLQLCLSAKGGEMSRRGSLFWTGMFHVGPERRGLGNFMDL